MTTPVHTVSRFHSIARPFRRAGLFALALLSLTTTWTARAAEPAEDADAFLEKALPGLVETYRHLHAHPELSGREKQTAALIAARLRKFGFAVTEGVGAYADSRWTCHGVVGVLENGKGPTVLLRTDLDALPIEEATGLPFASRVKAEDLSGRESPVMHACGHDLHMTVFLGTAAALAGSRDRWKGTLVLVGQPAEEIGAGSRALLEDGLYERFPRPDFALALHDHATLPVGRIACRPGYLMAGVTSVDITVKGAGGHGAYPHQSRDPVVAAAQLVLALQTVVSRRVSPLDPAVVTVGSIHGGTKRNIIPDRVRLELTLRTYRREVAGPGAEGHRGRLRGCGPGRRISPVSGPSR